jgi:hypothetical protein
MAVFCKAAPSCRPVWYRPQREQRTSARRSQSRLSRAWLIVLPVFLTEAAYPATPTMTVPLTPMTAAVKAGSMPGAYEHATQHSARPLIIRRSGV